MNQTCRSETWPMLLRPAVALVAFGGIIWIIGPGCGRLAAQEPTALEFAARTEGLVVDAIARGEKSLVAIGIDVIRRGAQRGALDPGLQQRIRSFRAAQKDSEPGEANWIPDEFASGVVVDASGLILTNYHVLGDLEAEDKDYDYWVTTAARQTYRASVYAADPRGDLAILKISAGNLTPIKMAEGSRVRKGQFVIALGNPYAIARDGQVSASMGIVSNLARKAAPDRRDEYARQKSALHHYGTLIQTDAKLNLGTSGGALVNLKGEMIGLTTSIAALAGYEKSAGYAIPVDDTFLRVLKALKSGREAEYGFLGIEPGNLRPDEVHNGRTGMRVVQVLRGTPAASSGLRDGDVITHVNGRPVHEADALILAVGRLDVESVVTLTVRRQDRPRALVAKLAKFPVRGKKVFQQRDLWRGVEVDYATALPGTNLNLLTIVGPSVVVVEVAASSPGHQAGVQRGMLITHVDQNRVASPRQFLEALRDRSGPVRLHVADRSSTTLGRVITVAAE